MKKKERAKYVKRLKYWQRECNLMDYELLPVAFSNIENEEEQAIISNIVWNHSNRWVQITLNKSMEYTDRKLNQTAFHEIMELRLGKLRDMAGEKYSWDEVDEQIHSIIRTLENLVLK
jgi:hypothetical protein